MTVVLKFEQQIPSGKSQVRDRFRKNPKSGNWVRFKCPNKRFEAWQKAAGFDLMIQKSQLPLTTKMKLPLMGPVRMTVAYHKQDERKRDVTGMADAIQHLLERMEILTDDGQIKQLDWQEVESGPCATVTLEGA